MEVLFIIRVGIDEDEEENGHQEEEVLGLGREDLAALRRSGRNACVTAM